MDGGRGGVGAQLRRDVASGLAAHDRTAPTAPNLAADARALAEAEARDLVSGTDTAAALAQSQAEAVARFDEQSAAHAARAVELRGELERRTLAADAMAAVLAEATASRRAAIRKAAAAALAEAREAYRAAALRCVDLASDLQALRALAQLGIDPSRSNTPTGQALSWPAVGCFTDGDTADLRELGARVEALPGSFAGVLTQSAGEGQARNIADYFAIGADLMGVENVHASQV